MFWKRRKRSDGIPADGGLIRAFGLQDWWNGLSSNVQQLILDRFGPGHELFSGQPQTANASKMRWFGQYADSFKRSDQVPAGLAILEAAESLGDASSVDWHFHLGLYQELRYKQRSEDPEAIEDTAAACERMIVLADEVSRALEKAWGSAPPRHLGFDRLIAIRKKQKRADEVERLEALRANVWDSRVHQQRG